MRMIGVAAQRGGEGMASKSTIPINDMQGQEIGVFSFNPADAGLPERIRELLSELPAISRQLSLVRNMRPDGTANGADAAIIQNAERRLYDAADRTFGAGTAAGIFREVKPFAVVCNGQDFFCSILARLCAVALKNRINGDKHES